MNKKTLAFCLSFLLLLSFFVSCTESDEANQSSTSNEERSAKAIFEDAVKQTRFTDLFFTRYLTIDSEITTESTQFPEIKNYFEKSEYRLDLKGALIKNTLYKTENEELNSSFESNSKLQSILFKGINENPFIYQTESSIFENEDFEFIESFFISLYENYKNNKLDRFFIKNDSIEFSLTDEQFDGINGYDFEITAKFKIENTEIIDYSIDIQFTDENDVSLHLSINNSEKFNLYAIVKSADLSIYELELTEDEPNNLNGNLKLLSLDLTNLGLGLYHRAEIPFTLTKSDSGYYFENGDISATPIEISLYNDSQKTILPLKVKANLSIDNGISVNGSIEFLSSSSIIAFSKDFKINIRKGEEFKTSLPESIPDTQDFSDISELTDELIASNPEIAKILGYEESLIDENENIEVSDGFGTYIFNLKNNNGVYLSEITMTSDQIYLKDGRAIPLVYSDFAYYNETETVTVIDGRNYLITEYTDQEGVLCQYLVCTDKVDGFSETTRLLYYPELEYGNITMGFVYETNENGEYMLQFLDGYTETKTILFDEELGMFYFE